MAKSLRNSGWQFRLAGFLVVGGTVISSGQYTLAQITPDATLGTENSVVTPNVDINNLPTDRIDGGALRGANLFHSFQEFNVVEGQRVYFANPAGIENILSRITGTDPSDILGTLGVDGGANLFLLNPNGIIFGPNAKLDIAGSFTASTADSLIFENGTQFSATNPDAPPLLSINITPGLQYGSNHAGAVTNAGNLATGQNLTLSGGTVTSTGQLTAPVGQVTVEAVAGNAQVRDVNAQTAKLSASDNLILEESQLQTTGDLTLLAEDTVRVRDSVTNPFLAKAGGNLYLQGNQSIDIWALNHPEAAFQSGGNLTLVSDGQVSGDAHFTSGGNFSILTLDGQPGTFVSLYDPIVSANGDVAFGSYTGVSLKVEATGSINVAGDIRITGPDTSLTPTVAIRGNSTVTRAADGTLQETEVSNSNGSVPVTNLDTFLGQNLSGTATEGSAVQTTFTALDGDILVFDWNFYTQETTPDPTYNDFAFATLSGPGAISGTVSASGQTVTNGLNVLANTQYPTFVPSSDGVAETGLQTFSATLATGGTYTLGIGVVDVEDNFTDSRVIVQNGRLVRGDTSVRLPVTDPDFAILNNSSALILRAGVTNLQNPPNVPQVGVGEPPGTNFTSPRGPSLPGNITVNGNISTSIGGGGPVILSAPGDINLTGSINSSTLADAANAGTIDLSAGGNINITGLVNPIDPNVGSEINSYSDNGDGGNINLAANGTVSISNIVIRSSAGSAGEGRSGDITIRAGATDPNLLAIRLVDTRIDAAAFGSNGRTGNVTINAINRGSIGLFGSSQDFEPSILTDTFASDDRAVDETTGGNITISGGVVTINNYSLNARVNAGSKGNGGSISIDGDFVTLQDDPNSAQPGIFNIQTSVIGGAEGKGGDITIASGSILIDGAQINANTQSSADTGIGGNITLTGGSVDITNSSRIDVSTVGVANGGNVFIEAVDGGSVFLTNNSDITATVSDTAEGAGGDITLTGGSVFIDSAGINASTSSSAETGVGGDIAIAAEFVGITNSSEVQARTLGAGNGGTISVEVADGNLFLDSSTISTNAQEGSQGDAGLITLNAGGNLFLDSSEISTNAQEGSQGDAGLITLNAGGNLFLDSSEISTNAEERAQGDAGLISLSAGSVALTNGSQVSAGNAGSGSGGGVFIESSNGGAIAIDNSIILTTSIDPFKDGTAGQTGAITIRGGSVALDSGVIDASNGGSGAGGLILVEAIDGGRVSLANNSIISSTLDARATGNGGFIGITAGSIDLTNNSQINASNFGAGTGGSVFVEATNGGSLSLENSSKINTAVELGATGQGGSIGITAGSVSLTGGSRLESLTRGRGNAGDILLDATESVDISGTSESGLSSGLLTSSETTTSGQGGNITVGLPDGNLGVLRVADGGVLSARTRSSSRGGNIEVNVNQLEVINGGQLITSATSSGRAGDITVDASESVTISGSNPNFTDLGASGGNTGNGIGTVTEIESNNTTNGSQLISSNLFSLQPNPNIDFSTDIPHVSVLSTGDGTFDYYSVEVTTPGSRGIFDIDEGRTNSSDGLDTVISLFDATGTLLDENDDPFSESDVDPGSTSQSEAFLDYVFPSLGTYFIRVGEFGFSPDSGDFAVQPVAAGNSYTLQVGVDNRDVNPNQGANSGLFAQATNGGTAGNLTINTGKLSVEDGGQVTVSSPQGQAGNLTVTADSILLDNGKLTAETGRSGAEGGANITLQVSDVLLMRNESLISANATGTANGGNVNIDTKFLVALPPSGSEGSDIVANAVNGDGGRVNLKAEGVFNIDFRPRRTPLNDITASSETGTAGVVSITTPNVDPSRGLGELPTNLVDATGLVDRSCQAGRGSIRNSSFIVTGRGGLPANPTEPLNSDAVLTDWVTLDSQAENRDGANRDANPNSSTPNQIIEAQGWVKMPDGRVILVAEAPTVTPHSPSFTPPSCEDVQAAND